MLMRKRRTGLAGPDAPTREPASAAEALAKSLGGKRAGEGWLARYDDQKP